MKKLHGAFTHTSKKNQDIHSICYQRLTSTDFAQKSSVLKRLLNIFY